MLEHHKCSQPGRGHLPPRICLTPCADGPVDPYHTVLWLAFQPTQLKNRTLDALAHGRAFVKCLWSLEPPGLMEHTHLSTLSKTLSQHHTLQLSIAGPTADLTALVSQGPRI